MDTEGLRELLAAYRAAPREFQATSYWTSYERRLIKAIEALDVEQLRSGSYEIFTTFGFNDAVYTYHPSLSIWKKLLLKFVHSVIIKDRAVLPYKLKTADIQELAYRHCELLGELTNSVPISTVEVSSFGSPSGMFAMHGKSYTMPFLSYYLRYCFANNVLGLKGDEIIVELGSGSGYQIEILKKMYPQLTVLCFDLPAQLFLCQTYLTGALGAEALVGAGETINWIDLDGITPGSVHFLGNWQLPLLASFKFDGFWNAASFGEMEPEVVANYLSYVTSSADWIYLLQAREGKETSGQAFVKDPISFDDYEHMLQGFELEVSQDAWHAHKRLSQSNGYFQAVWRAAR